MTHEILATSETPHLACNQQHRQSWTRILALSLRGDKGIFYYFNTLSILQQNNTTKILNQILLKTL